MIITFISDTHNKHKQIESSLQGGEFLIHAGDISSMGYKHEIQQFCKWFNSLTNYTHKIFIAGNHDWGFQINANEISEILNSYKTIDYLQDEMMTFYYDGPNGDFPDKTIRVYGTPWQPEFCNWAFNLPRNGVELLEKWNVIPENIDILITHSPAWGILDDVEGRRGQHLGCELLIERIQAIRPKIHVCGHIHSGYGYYFDGYTHFINASVLNEQYIYTQKPLTIEWDRVTNKLTWL
jgi:Icc-related predicted phosphoesterase